jgi:hypothetical protein
MQKIVHDLSTGETSVVSLTDEDKSKIAAGIPFETQADFERAIQARVDGAAHFKLFRDGVTLASYVASTNPQWAAQAQAFVEWRDHVWEYAYAELAKVHDGERRQPSIDEFLGELPMIEWPS